jgi:hypothetical protein
MDTAKEIRRPRWSSRIITIGAVLFAAGGAFASVNFEGLQEVQVRTLDHAQVRPDVVFTVYRGVYLDRVEIAYRTPDREQLEFPLDDEQKAKFQATLKQAFVSELVGLQNLEFVQRPDRDVMRLSVRVQDVAATVPPRSGGNVGRAAMALQAVGEATLVIELFDSQSGEILARAVDKRAIEGAAIAKDGGVITRWEGVEKLCQRWASTMRMRIDSLVHGR